MDNIMNEDQRLHFSSVAFGFGIASMATSVFLGLFPYVGIAFGCFAIFFSFISKGFYYKRDTKAKLGLIFGIVGVTIGVIIAVALIAFTLAMANSSDFYEILPEMDKMIGDLYMDEFGFLPSDLFKYIFSLGGIINV